MADPADLGNHFLIAMPALADPNFSHTVTYLCEHNEQGAMGLVINRPMDIGLGEVVDHMGLEVPDPAIANIPIHQGGPVQIERGFVLHEPLGNWEATLAVTDDIGVTMSRDVIEAIARGDGPGRFFITLGYAGWGGGQLEEELAANAWLNGPADPQILFDLPVEQRWASSAALLGVDLGLLSSDVGHA